MRPNKKQNTTQSTMRQLSALYIFFLLLVISGIACADTQPTPTECTSLVTHNTVAKHSRDRNVIKKLQLCLKSYGCDPAKIDGRFGKDTANALQNCSIIQAKAQHPPSKPQTNNRATKAPKFLDSPDVTYLLNEDNLKALKSKPYSATQPTNENTTSTPTTPPITEKGPAPPKPGSSQLKNIKQLQGIEYPTETLFRSAVLAVLGSRPTQKQLNYVIQTAKKKHVFDENKTIEWTGKSCGCVRSGLSGITYGFYPYWKSGKVQNIDFSYLSRIAYFGLSFDQEGNISSPLDWIPRRAGFINVARQHGTDIDLVIYQNNWVNWKNGNNLNYPDKDILSDNIIRIVTEKLSNTFFNKYRSWFSFFQSSTPTMADGVTLDFSNYPTDSASTQYLIDFIHILKKKLSTLNKKYLLNMVVPQSMFDNGGKGIFTLPNLSSLIPTSTKGTKAYDDSNYIDLFLVPLQEPTSPNKKRLRLDIESIFTGNKYYKGIQRRYMLRKIIPVIMPAMPEKNEEHQHQLKDDLIYFEDNFAGIGFWPLPISVDKPSNKGEKISNKIAHMTLSKLDENFQKPDVNPPSIVENIVCVNKWYFRLSFDLITLVLLIFGILAIFLCKVRDFWKRFSWAGLAILVVWGVFGLGMLFYDPFYADIARGNWPLVFLLVLNIIYIAWKIFKQNSRSKRP